MAGSAGPDTANHVCRPSLATLCSHAGTYTSARLVSRSFGSTRATQPETEAVSPDPTLIGGALASRSSKVSGEVLGRVGRGNSTKSAPETARLLYLPLCGLATDLDTEHGGTDANKRDGASQLGRLNVADVQL